jgi:hypothetical protein
VPPVKPGEDPEIRSLLKQYVGAKNSVPPAPNSAALETRLVELLVAKTESFERTRTDLAKQLGASIRDSGTFTPLGQDQLDNMFLRTENTRLQAEIEKLEKDNAELKLVIKGWTDRKNDWTIRIILTAIGALALYVWTLVTAARGGK